jgi:lipopolysaccharide heptosyltransferase II
MIKLEHIHSILIIKTRGIGDIVLATPVIENLHAAFPNAAIDFLTEFFAADVVRFHPHIRETIAFDRHSESGIAIIRRVRRKKYDLIIDLYANPRTALITLLSGARYRVGFPFRHRRIAYNILVPPRGGEVHNLEFNLDTLRYLGLPIVSSTPMIRVESQTQVWAEQWILQSGIHKKLIVGINPSGGWSTKRWGLGHFAALADRIADEYVASIVLFWGPGEEKDVHAIRGMMKHYVFIIPPTELKQLVALISQCHYVVSNDAGPMHIAAALNVPTLGIYGPTNPFLQGPYGQKHAWIRNETIDCLSCNLRTCPIGNICMTELNVEKVFSAFSKLVNKNPR